MPKTNNNATGMHTYTLSGLIPGAQTIKLETFVIQLPTITTYVYGLYTPRVGIITLISDNVGNLRRQGSSRIEGTITAAGALSLAFALVTKTKYTYRGWTDGYLSDMGNLVTLSTSQQPEFQILAGNAGGGCTFMASDAVTYGTNGDNVGVLATIGENVMTVPNGIFGESVFQVGSVVLLCRDSNIYSTAGVQIGTYDSASGDFRFEYNDGHTTGAIDAQSVFAVDLEIDAAIRQVVFRTSATNLTTSSLQIRYTAVGGTIHTATTDNTGLITGFGVAASSLVDPLTGYVQLAFTIDVIASSIKYDGVANTPIPVDPVLLGMNPIRLPIDGRVPIFTTGNTLVIMHEANTAEATLIIDQVVTTGRTSIARVDVFDVNGLRLSEDAFTTNLGAGTITMANPLVLQDKYGAALTAPFTITNRIEDMVLATDVSISGLISLSAPLTQAFPLGSTVASALVWGDVASRAFNYFDQQTWDDVYADFPTDTAVVGNYDLANYPVEIDNKSSVVGQWAIKFTAANTVQVSEKTLGVLLVGIDITTTDVAPINPVTGAPYFTLKIAGFGAGWQTGNLIRFNTEAGQMDLWMIRTILSGTMTETNDSIELEVRGDTN
jgi:hypothetical protein